MDILMYFVGQIFCQVIANENLETNSCLQILVVPTAIHRKDCEIWIKAILNPKDHSCSDSPLPQSRKMVCFLGVTVITFGYTWVWQNYQKKKEHSQEITIHPISCSSTLRQPWGKSPVR